MTVPMPLGPRLPYQLRHKEGLLHSRVLPRMLKDKPSPPPASSAGGPVGPLCNPPAGHLLSKGWSKCSQDRVHVGRGLASQPPRADHSPGAGRLGALPMIRCHWSLCPRQVERRKRFLLQRAQKSLLPRVCPVCLLTQSGCFPAAEYWKGSGKGAQEGKVAGAHWEATNLARKVLLL